MRIENFESVEEPNLQDTSMPIDHSDKTPEEEAKQEAKLEALHVKRNARKATGDGSKPTSKRKASSKTPKSAKPSTKSTKKSKKSSSAKTKSPQPKPKKAPKVKASPKKGPGRGIRADGKPRRKPGTNPPKDEERARFGRRMAKARKEKGWTQGQLAEKLGLSQPGVANIERGVCGGGPETPTRKAIEKKLGL